MRFNLTVFCIYGIMRENRGCTPIFHIEIGGEYMGERKKVYSNEHYIKLKKASILEGNGSMLKEEFKSILSVDLRRFLSTASFISATNKLELPDEVIKYLKKEKFYKESYSFISCLTDRINGGLAKTLELSSNYNKRNLPKLDTPRMRKKYFKKIKKDAIKELRDLKKYTPNEYRNIKIACLAFFMFVEVYYISNFPRRIDEELFHFIANENNAFSGYFKVDKENYKLQNRKHSVPNISKFWGEGISAQLVLRKLERFVELYKSLN